MIDSIIKPKRPNGAGWTRVSSEMLGRIMHAAGLASTSEAWHHPESRIQVFSSVEVARDPGQPDLGPEFHLSISKNGGSRGPLRTTSAEALWCVAQFDLADAKEDNHVPSGVVRNFWRPVADHLSGYECPCDDREPAMLEDKGDYIWRGVTR
ncbi:hypothetical protein [Cupriavidus alkaliphilus]|uniref:hypothetical protein n=1 Tax=Cupriavidus alkaliphilus TaxID=942866 RepID=UPI00339D595A